VTASPEGDWENISEDGSECLRSEADNLRLLLDLEVVTMATGSVDSSISSLDPVDTTVALESAGMPKSSLSNAEAGSMRSEISIVKPSLGLLEPGDVRASASGVGERLSTGDLESASM